MNKIIIKNHHALPLISEILNWLIRARWFIKFNLKDAYHWLCIRCDNEWKTAFCMWYGHFEYMVMPFGLSNVPATFQAYINKALINMVNVFCVVYLNDILIYSSLLEKHWNHVRQVLKCLCKFQFFANLKKCAFAVQQVDFLEFVISAEEVVMNPNQISTIADWPTPKTYQKVQVFLNFVNFYWCFVKDYSRIAEPLTELFKESVNRKKQKSLQWSKVEVQIFKRFHISFISVSMLIHFNFELYLRIKTDASEYALTGILSQFVSEGTWHSVIFWLKKMISAEQQYEIHNQELLAIIMAFKQWRHYLKNSTHSVEVLTDYNNLWGFMNVKSLNGR